MILSVSHDVVLAREAPSQGEPYVSVYATMCSCLLAAMSGKLRLKLGGPRPRRSRVCAGTSMAEGFLRSKTSPTQSSQEGQGYADTEGENGSEIGLPVWPRANPNKLQPRTSHVLL